MPKVLVTGATGLLGSALTRHLVRAGTEVRILRRETSRLDALGDVARNVEHTIGDLNDAGSLRDAMAGIDLVYHTAAYVSFEGQSDRDALMQSNVEGTAGVVNAALEAGIRRLVHTSSMSAFGRPEPKDAVLDEKSQWHRSRAHSVYAQSKYLSELQVHRGVAEGLDGVIVNPSLIFGTGRAGMNTRRLVDRLRDGRLPAIPSGGTNVVDVLDVVDGIVRAMERGRTGERYFLGSENLSWRRIIHTLSRAFDVQPPRPTLPPAPTMILALGAEALSALTGSRPAFTREQARSASRFYRYSNRKAIEELGCSFRPFAATAERLASRLEEDVSPAP